MKVTDCSEGDQEITLQITDHTGASHRVTLTSVGNVTDHWCDTYPRGDDPTPLETVRLARAERFAKYYLQRTTNAKAIDPYTDSFADPDQLVVTAMLVATMSQETISKQFTGYYEQLTAPRTDTVPPVEPPRAIPATGYRCVEQDLALASPRDSVARLSDVLHEIGGLETLRQALDVRPDRGDADLFERLHRLLPSTDDGSDDPDRRGRFLQIVSPLRVHWATEDATRVKYGEGTDADTDIPVDVRLQLTEAHYPVISVAAFQRTLVDHLRCQARDCYVAMGLRPPGHLQVTGHGISDSTERYERLDGLQNYHDERAIIDWTQLSSRSDF